MIRLPLLSGLIVATVAGSVWANVPATVVTPDVVETSRGMSEFKNGVPTEETAQAHYNQHDFTFAYRAYMDTTRNVSFCSLRRGEGGKFLIVPLGYDGPLPDGGEYAGRILRLGLVNNASYRNAMKTLKEWRQS